jgi:hypothetical protein
MTKNFRKIRPFDWSKKQVNNQKMNPGVSSPYLSEVYDIKIKKGFHHKSRDICDTKLPKSRKRAKIAVFLL